MVEKQIYSSALKAMVPNKNRSDNCNFEMNDNNIVDQLCLVYHLMRIQKNNKWWWDLFLWEYKMLMVNSYELKGAKMMWTHHDWNETIGNAHLDPVEDWIS